MLILTAGFYACYNVFIKVSSSAMNPVLGMLMLQAGAIGIGIGAFFYARVTAIPPVFPQKGVICGLLAGVFVALAEAASFYVFAKGVPASTGIPVIIGGSVVISAVLGAIFLKEALNPLQFAAIGLIVAGIAILKHA